MRPRTAPFLLLLLAGSLLLTGGATAAAGGRLRPAACVERLVTGAQQVERTRALVRCAQPQSLVAQAQGSWSTCAGAMPGTTCSRGSWSVVYRASGPFAQGSSAGRIATWGARGVGSLVCRWRAGAARRSTASFRVRRVTLALARTGSRVAVAAAPVFDAASRSRRAVACGHAAMMRDARTIAGLVRGLTAETLLGPATVQTTVSLRGWAAGRPAQGAVPRGSASLVSTVRFAG